MRELAPRTPSGAPCRKSGIRPATTEISRRSTLEGRADRKRRETSWRVSDLLQGRSARPPRRIPPPTDARSNRTERCRGPRGLLARPTHRPRSEGGLNEELLQHSKGH